MNPVLFLLPVMVVTASALVSPTPSPELTQKWCEWIADIPIKDSPLFDKDGTFTQKHMYQEDGNIYFLTGYINSKSAPGQLDETRQITVNRTGAIFVPILNGMEIASASPIQKIWHQLNPFAAQELHDKLQKEAFFC